MTQVTNTLKYLIHLTGGSEQKRLLPRGQVADNVVKNRLLLEIVLKTRTIDVGLI